MSEESPLIKALPPATDYLTYLTLIEYNLNVENLPILHDVLQDTTLTTNIGWDLVHLLVPLLPASDECLQDIARLGNPREVILKVTESLRLIDYEGLQSDSDDEQTVAGSESQASRHPAKTAAVGSDAAQGSAITQAVEVQAPPPLPVLQFTSLLSMLSVLHVRIKTQYPSRFLSTTLQAVLVSFANSVSHKEELISAIAKFVKNMSGTKRPHLPPRKSSASLATMSQVVSAPDPEADTNTSEPSSAEAAMQSRLLQSFVTHLLEAYILSFSSKDDVPGLAWCSRLQEKIHPKRTIPGKLSMTERFNSSEELKTRLTGAGELIALARDLGIKTRDLASTIQHSEKVISLGGDSTQEDEPPRNATDIPLSKVGCLFLLTADKVYTTLYGEPPAKSDFDVFPEHNDILTTFVSGSSQMGDTIGTEPEAVLDAVLALAVLAVEADQIGEPADNEQFNQYLQYTSLISSNSPSPNLRYHAFYLTSTILRSNPSDQERLAFIRDTLEHCPFENLKVGAISWIKGETIEANPPTPVSGQESHSHGNTNNRSIFATSVALDTLSPYLFPDLTHDLSSANLTDSWLFFEQNLHFYLASLNFYYLLLSAPHLHENLAIGDLHSNTDIAGSFLQPLRTASAKFREEGKEGGQLYTAWQEAGNADGHFAELQLLDVTLERVTGAVARLN